MATPRGKAAHEYVLVEDHATIIADLAKSSFDMQASINEAVEAAQLHNQKYELVAQARSIVDELQALSHDILKDMPVKEAALKPKPRARHPIVTKPKTVAEEHEFLKRSMHALENLHKNITELKSELKKQ